MPSIETSYSWARLVVSITLSTLGCVGMWSLVVALPAVQADSDAPRSDATLPYTLTTIGFMLGGIIVGRLADRFGILPPLAGGTILMSLGYASLRPLRACSSSRSSPASPSASAAQRA